MMMKKQFPTLSTEQITRQVAIYEKVMYLYEAAFPANERAPLDSLIEKRDWKGDNRAYFLNGEFCGFSFCYIDDQFCYLFYLAVEPQMRKKGVGSAIIQNLIATYPDRRLILEMEELDPAAENYQERLNRSHFYQGNGLILTNVHNTQFGVPYHVLCTDSAITLADYSRMWHNIVRLQGYSEEDGQKWLNDIFGGSIG